MKKIILLLITIVLVLPLNAKASSAAISGASMAGTDTVTVGKEFSQSFLVNFSNIKKGTTDTLGIWIVAFELDYDESIFIPQSISTDGNVWNSTIYKQNGKTYVLSEFANDPFKNACVDGVLYCADYLVTIKFYVKDTTNQSSVIKMKNTSAGAFQLQGGSDPEYDTDDMIELEYSLETSKTFKINRPENVEVKEPQNVISNSKPVVEKPAVDTNKSSENKSNNQEVKETKNEIKADNNYLKSLEVKNYQIDFKKTLLFYNIDIEKDINQLEITAEAENSKAVVEVIGADNLKENDYQVSIKVKAETGEEKIYTIKANLKEEKENNETKKNNTSKPNKLVFIIGGGVIALIVVIGVIYNIINNKKIDRGLDF